MWTYTSTPIRLHGAVLNYLSTGTTLPFIIKYSKPLIGRVQDISPKYGEFISLNYRLYLSFVFLS
jgi:hypothetical protein